MKIRKKIVLAYSGRACASEITLSNGCRGRIKKFTRIQPSANKDGVAFRKLVVFLLKRPLCCDYGTARRLLNSFSFGGVNGQINPYADEENVCTEILVLEYIRANSLFLK